MTEGKLFVICGLALFGALIVVGIVADGVARHIIQTAPVWVVIALGMRESSLAKWAALPISLFWLAIMTLIWLFLLHVASIASGHYAPVEIAMTFVVAAASLLAFAGFLWAKTYAPGPAAGLTVLTVAALQVGVFALSLQAPFNSDTALMAWLHGSRLP